VIYSLTPIVVNIRNFNEFTLYIGRDVKYKGKYYPWSKWANPFTKSQYGDRCIKLYENYIKKREDLMDSLKELEGQVLGCWCKPNPCHGDILVKLFKGKFVNDNIKI